MFVNELMLNLLSDNVLGVPIVAKLGKNNAVKSIYSIPYKIIGRYLSNVRGNFIGQRYSAKSGPLERLIEYSNTFNMNDWYSVEAVKAFCDIDIEDDIDKNIVAWYNPYVKKIVCITDAYKNPIEKPQSVSTDILQKYLAKNEDDKQYFVDIILENDSNNTGRIPDRYADAFFLVKSGIAKRINFLRKNADQWQSTTNLVLDEYISAIESVPQCRFMEVVLLAAFEKAIHLSYALSDNNDFSWCYHYSRESLMLMKDLTRMRVALNMFYQNSILAFKGLVQTYGDVNSSSIGRRIVTNHFSQTNTDDDWIVYTDAFYRIVALCVGFASSNTAVASMAKIKSIFGLSATRSYNCDSNAIDSMLGTNKSYLASWFSECFCLGYKPDVPIGEFEAKYKYNSLLRFVTDTVLSFKASPYFAFNGDVIVYYKKGREFYDYAKL